MPLLRPRLFLGLLALTPCPALLIAQSLPGLVNDSALTNSILARPTEKEDEVIRLGEHNSDARAVVFVFKLPDFGPVTDPFASASFSFTLLEAGATSLPLAGLSGGKAPEFNLDLYGLGARPRPDVLGDDGWFSAQTQSTGAKLLAADLVTARTPPGVVIFGGSTLAAYLNAQYDRGRGAGLHVFIRLNPDASPPGKNNEQRYRVAMADNLLFGGPAINYSSVTRARR